MARPKKEIDESKVLYLASDFCTNEEIAAVLDCSADTLARRFADTLKKGRETAKSSLRSKQWQLAKSGNATMLIWLGKQYLGQADKVETENKHSGSLDVSLDRDINKIYGDGTSTDKS